MMKTLRLLLPALILSVLPCSAQFDFMSVMSPTGADGADSPTLELAADANVTSYKKGESFCLSVRGTITEPWHAYYRNPGTVGQAMTAELQAPEGFSVSEPVWSMPEREEGVTGVAYIHTHPVITWVITPQDNAPAEADFTVTAAAQLCSGEGCMPEQTVSTALHLAAGDGAPNAAWQRPAALDTQDLVVSATQDGDTVKLTFTGKGAPTAGPVYFFSDDNSIDPTAPQIWENGTLTLTRNAGTDTMYPVADPDSVGLPLTKLSGALRIGDSGAGQEIAVEFAPAAPAAAGEGMLMVCLSLFLGGLILNLMPCVFPVIGLKVMSFVQLGGGERRKIIAHALTFVAGILVSFWVIAALIALFTDPATRSWAAWMQNAWVVYGITLLLLVLGMSMFGIFEIGVGATGAGQGLQSKGGLVGSFFQGLLITVVATPCSAPFLGAALPAAMAQPAGWMTLALTFMALGLSLPYIILGCFPALVGKLPAPGAWMESLKQALSFLMFAAAAWFLLVYLAFVDHADAPWVMVSMVVIAAAFWVYGRWCPIYRSKKERLTGLIVALLLLILGVIGSMPKSDDHPQWVAWSPAAMQEALEEGKPVYVDFTATWCATCQSNKKLAYSEEVYGLVKEHDIVLMRADMTKPNADIAKEMKKLKRSNVPVNALYMPDEKPAVTQELLSAGYLYDFLKEHLTEEEGEEESSDETSSEETSEAPTKE